MMQMSAYYISNRHPGLVPGSTAPRTDACGEEWTPAQGRGDGLTSGVAA